MQWMGRVAGEIEWRLHERDDVRLHLPRPRVFDPAEAKVLILPRRSDRDAWSSSGVGFGCGDRRAREAAGLPRSLLVRQSAGRIAGPNGSPRRWICRAHSSRVCLG